MAINKKLIHFKNKENFDKEVANENILDTSIVFIQDSKEISTHGTVYKTVNWSVLEPEPALAGDICLYDKNADKLIIVSASEDLANYPADSYSPVGVVVVPSTHDVYGDGSCGVMSMKPMSLDTPDTGDTSDWFIYWGGYGTDISTLPNLNNAPYIGKGTYVGNSTNTILGLHDYPRLPSDIYSAVKCPHDTDTYYNSSSSSHYQAPSPFLTDGSRNPAYYQTSFPSDISNALADFDGVGNTKILTGLATSQSDWKTASTITHSYDDGYYPAACCCWRYHTDGTKQGDWYLPAMGELGYIMPNFNKINTTISMLINAYSVGVQLVRPYSYWSSSEYSSDDARGVDADNGLVDREDKDSQCCVRAFLRVKP